MKEIREIPFKEKSQQINQNPEPDFDSMTNEELIEYIRKTMFGIDDDSEEIIGDGITDDELFGINQTN